MTRTPGRLVRLLALTTALALAGVACGGDDDSGAAPEGTTTTTAAVATGPGTPAALVRSNLGTLLGEHTVLAAGTAGAAVAGRDADFAAAKAQLDANSAALTKLISAVLGAEAGTAFDPLWKQHVDLLVQYTQGSAAALAQLIDSTKQFGAFIHSALPDASADTLAGLVEQHVLGIKAVVDAQRAGDFGRAYQDLRSAFARAAAIAEPLSAAIAKAFPDKVGGDPTSPAADLLVTLDQVLEEHTYLVGFATGAALGARTPEYTGASAALDASSTTVTAAIASVYGSDVGKAFDPLWKKHISFFVSYTEARAAKDSAKADTAVDRLLAYAKEFGTFINSGSPALPADTVANLITTHVFTVKDVIDAQAAGNPTRAWAAFREAGAHMTTISAPLAEALVAQFPDKF